jgi:hypothetical protein
MVRVPRFGDLRVNPLKDLALRRTTMTGNHRFGHFTPFRNAGRGLMKAVVIFKAFRGVPQFATNQKNPGTECNSQESE